MTPEYTHSIKACPEPAEGLVLSPAKDGTAEVGVLSLVKESMVQAVARVKPWKRGMYLLVFSPKYPKGSEDQHGSRLAQQPGLRLICDN